MSSGSITKESNLETTSPQFESVFRDFESFLYSVTHVLFPVQLPDSSDYTLEKDLLLARAVRAAAHAYTAHGPAISEPRWNYITKMLDNLQASVQSERLDKDRVISQLREMQTGDTLGFFTRSHNSAIIITKREIHALIELFEVSPSMNAVDGSTEPLICSYPAHAIEIPNILLDSGDFQLQLTGALSCQNLVDSDHSSSHSPHAQYDTSSFSGFLGGVGHTGDVPRIVKRVRDDVRWDPPKRRMLFEPARRWVGDSAKVVWRRSSLWLFIRIAIQISLDRYALGHAPYKAFMLFFICTLARDPIFSSFSSDLRHQMASKILRRLGKLGSSVSDWLSQLALETCANLEDTPEPSSFSSPFRNPSQEELARDTQLSLEHSAEYIHDTLANHAHKSTHTSFDPSHRQRGTIDYFLSSDGAFFDDAYDADPEVTLYEVEQSVERGIDDWTAGVTDVNDACAQLLILMDKYMKKAYKDATTEDRSMKLLTAIELFVALDKLVVKEIPILADYSPDIPITELERLSLRRITSLHRLSCAYQYLSARHSRSRPGWSLLSNEFTEDSFPVRYYDRSPYHQQLKARIDEEAMVLGMAQSPLPSLPLHTKVVVFELQCPVCIRIWRSALVTMRSHHFSFTWGCEEWDVLRTENLLSHAQVLQSYFVDHHRPPLDIEIHFAYFYPGKSQCQNTPTLCYAIQYPNNQRKTCLSLWQSRLFGQRFMDSDGVLSPLMDAYGNDTRHTPNDVLAAQEKCPDDLSLDEFIVFGHLRSGGSLQWTNILHGLRSRTLNLRRHVVHTLLTRAVLRVGPLDLNTGTWIWYQDLQESSFCGTFLDELEDLFVEVGAGLMDGVIMSSISLLLTRVLAGSPSEDVSERAIGLLRRVRRKTFGWVEELLYDLAKAPTNKERRELLLRMAATCRSTFDVDPATFSKLFNSAEDVDALISGSFLAHALRPKFDLGMWPDVDRYYSNILVSRDQRLTLALEDILRNVVLSDVSDYGIDLAVCKIIPNHKPGPNRWEPLQHHDARWLTCQTGATMYQSSPRVHLNLLDGTLRAGGQQVGGLPRTIRDDDKWQYIFRDQGFFSIPSNMPGMDFTTVTTAKYKVHFSLRGDSLVVRAQCSHSKDIIHLIPSEKLEKDLPSSLVNGHVHWLNLSTGIIEIRPLKHVWEESAEHWRIDCGSKRYRAYKGDETLVKVCSPTWTMVSKCFDRFNNFRYSVSKWALGTHSLCPTDTTQSERESNNLIITTSPIEPPQSTPVRRLSAALSHYGLAFFVNDMGELESRDFKHMVYDENQCVSALFGLRNLLVLRQKAHHPDHLILRRVLIPTGYPTKQGDHRVEVAYDRYITGEHEPLYHVYNVDTELGCLMGLSGSLESMHYLASLHAQTSCHRPDPLTGKMGAQAAFGLLQSAACRSIMRHKTLYGAHRFDDDTIFKPYPQIQASYREIIERCYWDRDTNVVDASEKRAMQRAAYLSPYYRSIGRTSPQASGHDNASDYVTTSIPAEPRIPTVPSISNEQAPWPIMLEQLLSDRSAPELPARANLDRHSHKRPSEDVSGLTRLLSSFPTDKPSSLFQQGYLTHLEDSAQCIRMDSRLTHKLVEKDKIDMLQRHYMQCRQRYFHALAGLKQRLSPTSDPYEQALSRFGHWPPVTADTLLRYLASTSSFQLPGKWKKCMVSLALLLLDLQRARRLLRFALDGLKDEFSKELDNEGCEGWDAEDYPDWLLIQIEGDFLIRRSQAETAMEMMFPRSGGNTVMQVNMGEGKSSVIIPIVAAALADGKQLVRVVVPKALTSQMFDLLVARLGGLVNRPIYHLPFSRSPEYNYEGKVISLQINDLHKLMSQCMAEQGILLVQPEHVASLKLMAIEEQLCKGNLPTDPLPAKPRKSIHKHIATITSLNSLVADTFVDHIFRWLSQPLNHSKRVHDEHSGNAHSTSDSASKWLSLQTWIHSNVRDVLDESDEILHPRFQLIYTIGLEQYMDGYPDRWTIIQQVLRLVKECTRTIAGIHPNSVEFELGPPGSFPYFGITRGSNIGRRLILLTIEQVMAGRLPGLNFHSFRTELRDAIRSFISDEDILQVPHTAKRIEEHAKSSEDSRMWSGLLILRGLLSCNILLFALAERRWRVDYGLVPQPQEPENKSSSASTKLVVPYRAKDVPAPNTQFGHPDITIILTCLSYYYGGLTEKQLRTSFEILIDEDDPTTEYALWVKDHEDGSMPDSLQTLGDINLKASEQWDKVVFPLFSRNQATIDFYLSRVVFPREAKEFPWKLSASSWDLAEARERLITGFSGTNDSKWLLPMSVIQDDLDHQRGTNARVLAYLLQPKNDFYLTITSNGRRQTTLEFLRMIAAQKEPPIRVLLDVGAQILDYSSHQVSKEWLDISSDADGAVYFDEHDELRVLSRNGTTSPMALSPLSQQLDRCIVYLDHVHTRGTDIKLPIGSRAAVTLGPKLTKDSLVQGCMRMRKLGHGHSVMFFAPLEVDLSIRAVAGKSDPETRVTTVDILRWAIHETWTDIQQRAPHWAQQGMSHKARHGAWSSFCNNNLTSEQLSDAWLQSNQKSLEDLYAPCKAQHESSNLVRLEPEIQQRCKDLEILSLPSAEIVEEQEREVNREREREREVELPPVAEALEHSLHPDVVAFVQTGIVPPLHSGSAFRPVFTTLDKSSAAAIEGDVWSPFILATTDFCDTIKLESTQGTIDQYLRPVQWVLSNIRDYDRVLVLVSPFEADRLMPDIRASEHIHLHVYAPRTSKRMKPSDDLRLYSIPSLPSDWIPPWTLIDQLNVFSGQLYLRDHQSYLRLCHFLGVPMKGSPNDGAAQRNLFNIPGSFEENEIMFSGSPLPSVMALLAIRTRGGPFAHTHMGKILQGRVLTVKDFEEPELAVSNHATTTCGEETQGDFASGTMPSSPSEMECDPGPSSVLLPSSKRRLETTELCDMHSEPLQKRPRLK